jgi:hypothetical protein
VVSPPATFRDSQDPAYLSGYAVTSRFKVHAESRMNRVVCTSFFCAHQNRRFYLLNHFFGALPWLTGRPSPLPAAKQLVHLKQDETDESKQEGYKHG